MRIRVFVLVATLVAQATHAQESTTNKQTDAPIRERLQSYVETFNGNDAGAVAAFWTQDAVSLNEETGERTVGRDALQKEFAEFFAGNAGARLAGQIDQVRMIRPDVAVAEGEVSLVLPDDEPVPSSFTAIMVKEGDQWLISSSQERGLPTPPTPYDALKDLEWLVGSWQDQGEDVRVNTTVRWSPSQSFLIRSFNAQFGDGEMVEGTQVFGWDPLNKTIRTWVFNSDGSYGDGTVSRNGEEWIVKMTQMLSDGRLGTATQVVKRVDNDTIEVQRIGETIDGADPVPASEPVVVVRTGSTDDVSSSTSEAPQSVGGTR
jgi:uncharacterized protein (TIGR02246 family)